MTASRQAGAKGLRTLLFTRTFESGDRLLRPVVDERWCALEPAGGSGWGGGAEELELFLQELLAGERPETIARYSLPAATLVEVEVPLRRIDLPDRAQLHRPIAIPCAVIAQDDGGRWVVALPLGHTFFVARDEPLEAAIRAEVGRVAAAHQLDGHRLRDLLPAAKHSLEWLEIGRPDPIDGDRQPIAAADRQAAELLEAVALPLHEQADAEAPPVLHREDELAQLEALLDGERRCGVLLVGPELVGKATLLRAWLRRAWRPGGSRRRIYQTSPARLLAGMSGLGQWQERLRRVLGAVAQLDAVLYLPSLADLFGDRPAAGGVDLPAALKPWLESGRVRLCAALTPSSCDLLEPRSPGLFAALHRVQVAPLDAPRTADLLQACVAFYSRRRETPNLTADAAEAVLELVDRYLPHQAWPGKAVRLFESLRTAPRRSADPVGRAEVFEVFSQSSGIPAFLLREQIRLEREQIEAFFAERLVGQAAAVRHVAEILCVIKAGLQPAGKPLATFLFVGPTGVGKTELARLLASYLFGAADRMVRLDMSEYMDPQAAERLIEGAGGRAGEGVLTRAVRRQPFCVLLLDEIEKAHPAVFDLLLQICGEGRLTDGRGRLAHFHNAIIIMTSNLGVAERRPPIGLVEPAAQDEAAYYMGVAQRRFRPEFVNRLDRIVAFHPLGDEAISRVAALGVDRIRVRRGLVERGIELELTAEALRQLATEGADAEYGARALRRHLEDHLAAPIARALGRLGEEARGARVRISCLDQPEDGGQCLLRERGGALRLEVIGGREQATRDGALGQAAAIAALRRRLDELLRLPVIVQVRDQLAWLTSELSDARLLREAAQLSRRQQEHHRLDGIWRAAAEPKAALYELEIRSVRAALGGEAAPGLLPEASQIWRRFQRELVHLLGACLPHRDAATLLLQELDNRRALDRYLVPLLDGLGRLGWRAQVHFEADPPAPGEDWPRARQLGPPRPPAAAIDRLLGGRDRLNVLLRVQGPWAGVMLPLERGVHRWYGSARTMLHCRAVARRVAFTDAEWFLAALRPTRGADRAALRREPMARSHLAAPERLRLGGVPALLDISSEAYWAHLEEVAGAHLLHHLAGNPGGAERLYEMSLPDTPPAADGDLPGV